MNKIAVIFPGIGYTCDKPLLYYGAKLAQAAGFDIKRVEYGGFANGVKGNRQKMLESFELALEQSEKILSGIDWNSYGEILFISKSIGTAVAGAYAEKHELTVRSILYTPLTDTFRFVQLDTIAFHGTSDPWAETEEIISLSEKNNIPLYLTESANHSLETGDVLADIAEMRRVMEISRKFIDMQQD